MLPMLLAAAAFAQDRPVGDADKSMYERFLLTRVQWEPELEEEFPVLAGLSLSLPRSDRLLLGAALDVRKPNQGPDLESTSVGNEIWGQYRQWPVRPSVRGEYALIGTVPQGWFATAELALQGVSHWDDAVDETRTLTAKELAGKPHRGVIVEPGLALGPRMTFHPGFTLQVEGGVRVRAIRTDMPDNIDSETLVPFVRLSSGWAMVPGGLAPTPGYRSRDVTGKRKVETKALLITGGVLALGAAGTGVGLWWANRGTVVD